MREESPQQILTTDVKVLKIEKMQHVQLVNKWSTHFCELTLDPNPGNTKQISAWELAWKPHTGQTFREHRLLPIPSRGSCHLPPIGCCQFLPQVSVAYCCTDASAAAGPNPRPPPPRCLGSEEGSAGLLGPAVAFLQPLEGCSPLMNKQPIYNFADFSTTVSDSSSRKTALMSSLPLSVSLPPSPFSLDR